MATVRSADGTTHRTPPGQNHMVKAQAIAPVLTEFFTQTD